MKNRKFAVSLILTLVSFGLVGCGQEDPYADAIALDEETSSTFVYEAEEAVITSTKAEIPYSSSNYAEYSGNGHVVVNEDAEAMRATSGSSYGGYGAYVGYLGAEKGDNISWTINSASAVEVLLSFAFSPDGSVPWDTEAGCMTLTGTDCAIEVNGTLYTEQSAVFSMANTSFFKSYDTKVTLKKGENVIKLVANSTPYVSSMANSDFCYFYDGQTVCPFPDVDYMTIEANVEASNFTFTPKTDNEKNLNGKLPLLMGGAMNV